MDPRRNIPSVDRLLASDAFARLLERMPRALVVTAVQRELEAVRTQLADRAETLPRLDADDVAERVAGAIRRLQAGSLVPVLNATGVVLHTNLGRAPLARAAMVAIERIALGYSNLEYDLDTGARGSRYVHARELLVALTDAEDALVVNNNAAALVLALNTLARGREAIISRGELVEIGGAFRVPEIMARSGARLREVGSTNRTHHADYRAALSPRTGVLLKVHPSNFTISGYTAAVDIEALAPLAREHGVPLLHDVGSGLLLDPATLGLDGEPWAPASLRAGADVVTLSGDKLLGGPQCGILVGRRALLERMRRNPLCRALRVDKLTLAALEATLRLYLEPERARTEIPALAMLTTPLPQLRVRAEALAERCRAAGLRAGTEDGTSAVGGGASPGAVVPTWLVHIAGAAQHWQRRLRAGDPSVVARIADDRLILDLRTVPPAADDELASVVLWACAG
jgi:L-seryl-tRNA(Ser) seleniumtransferase